MSGAGGGVGAGGGLRLVIAPRALLLLHANIRSTRATGVCGISETVNGALYELTEFFSTFRKA